MCYFCCCAYIYFLLCMAVYEWGKSRGKEEVVVHVQQSFSPNYRFYCACNLYYKMLSLCLNIPFLIGFQWSTFYFKKHTKFILSFLFFLLLHLNFKWKVGRVIQYLIDLDNPWCQLWNGLGIKGTYSPLTKILNGSYCFFFLRLCHAYKLTKTLKRLKRKQLRI